MQYAIDHAADLLSLTLIAPGSPYGFGGTKDVAGTPNYPDFAGSGGGTANPDFVKRLSEGDRSTDSPNSPRNVMNEYYFKPPFKVSPQREEVFVSAMCAIRIGDGFYPGDMTPSPNWSAVAPGTKGNNNTISPKYCDQSGLAHINPSHPSCGCAAPTIRLSPTLRCSTLAFSDSLARCRTGQARKSIHRSQWSARYERCWKNIKPMADATRNRRSPTAGTRRTSSIRRSAWRCS